MKYFAGHPTPRPLLPLPEFPAVPLPAGSKRRADRGGSGQRRPTRGGFSQNRLIPPAKPGGVSANTPVSHPPAALHTNEYRTGSRTHVYT